MLQPSSAIAGQDRMAAHRPRGNRETEPIASR